MTDRAADSEKRDAELRRRALVIFKSVDPDVVSKAGGAVWSGLFGVICALRVKFALSVSLGVSIGNMLTPLFRKHVEPHLVRRVLPETLSKWVSRNPSIRVV